jgi:hypothetical protein
MVDQVMADQAPPQSWAQVRQALIEEQVLRALRWWEVEAVGAESDPVTRRAMERRRLRDQVLFAGTIRMLCAVPQKS